MAGIEVIFPSDNPQLVLEVGKVINDLGNHGHNIAYRDKALPTGYAVCWDGFDTEYEVHLMGYFLETQFVRQYLKFDCCLAV